MRVSNRAVSHSMVKGPEGWVGLVLDGGPGEEFEAVTAVDGGGEDAECDEDSGGDGEDEGD